jgi:NAD(P)-dependent dehydrogenase (short-subunit alcohol dehydrogenase family)
MGVAAGARAEAKRAASLGEQPPRGQVRAYGCDVADRDAVERLFERAAIELGDPELVVFNAGAFVRAGILEIDPREFERCWCVGCLGGLHVG